MRRRRLIITFVTGLAALCTGCAKFSSPVNPSASAEQTLSGAEELVLGSKLSNPYSLSTMRRARDSLVARGVLGKSALSDGDLTATHYYIRFKPANDSEYIALNIDTSFVLWDYPLDYDIAVNGTSYRDPEIPAGQPNYLYTTVAVGRTLPAIANDILDELILEPDESAASLAKGGLVSQYKTLEHEALRITDNLPVKEPGLFKALGSWRPKGNISVYDNVLNKNVPIYRVEVRVRNWFKWVTVYTDANGNFDAGKDYLGDVSYSLRWQYKSNVFDIRTGDRGQAFYNGPNQSRSAWNLVISSQLSWFYAHLFRAGAYYCGQEPYGLKDNPFDYISIQAMDEKTPADGYPYYRATSENVKIYRYKKDGAANNAQNLFIITTHELAHAEHDEIYTGGSYRDNIESRVKEAWAYAVSYYLSSSVYTMPVSKTFEGYDITLQYWAPVDGGDKIPLIIDLIDNFDQIGNFSFQTTPGRYIRDRVTGYTLKQCETIIAKAGCRTVADFKREIKALALPAGMTAQLLDEYLNQY